LLRILQVVCISLCEKTKLVPLKTDLSHLIPFIYLISVQQRTFTLFAQSVFQQVPQLMVVGKTGIDDDIGVGG
jgi:hypothetical protein